MMNKRTKPATNQRINRRIMTTLRHICPERTFENSPAFRGRVEGAWKGILVLYCAATTAAWAIEQPAQIRTEAAALSPAETNTVTQQRRGRFSAPERGVYKARITPHWFQDDARFWYRNDLKGNTKEFIVVDTAQGTRQPAFDHERLAAALSKAAGQEFKADLLPFQEIEFSEDGKFVKFDAADKSWQCNLATYECTIGSTNKETKTSSLQQPSSTDESGATVLAVSSGTSDGFDLPPADDAAAAQSPPQASGGQRRQRSDREDGAPRGQRRSPDGKWAAFLKDNNVFMRSEEDEKEYQLTHDGEEGDAYGRLEWSPDSQAVVGWRIGPGARKEVFLIESSPRGGGRACMHRRPLAQAGDKFTAYEPSLFQVAERKQ